MANIRVYHFMGSPPSNAVFMTAETLGVPLELKPLDFMKKEHLQPEFTKINPDQTVPTMIDGDFTLWESRAIMRYLVGKFGGEDNSLYPRDLQKRAEVDRLLDYDLGVFYNTLIEGVWLPFRDRTPKTKEQEDKVTKVLSRIDTLLKDKKFLTGDNVTIADFSMVVGFSTMLVYEGDKSKFPNAMAWYKRMQEATCFKGTYDKLKDFVEIIKKRHAELP